jgi:hypothetical protein
LKFILLDKVVVKCLLIITSTRQRIKAILMNAKNGLLVMAMTSQLTLIAQGRQTEERCTDLLEQVGDI